jgi:hypothetical protein
MKSSYLELAAAYERLARENEPEEKPSKPKKKGPTGHEPEVD